MKVPPREAIITLHPVHMFSVGLASGIAAGILFVLFHQSGVHKVSVVVCLDLTHYTNRHILHQSVCSGMPGPDPLHQQAHPSPKCL